MTNHRHTDQDLYMAMDRFYLSYLEIGKTNRRENVDCFMQEYKHLNLDRDTVEAVYDSINER